MDETSVHVPVLLQEVVELLNPRPGMTVLDATVGAGGHAQAIVEHLGKSDLLLACDRDSQILEVAKKRLAQRYPQIHFYQASFSVLADVLQAQGNPCLDAWLLDLGVSSWQLETAARGFSFLRDGPLDMRMNQEEIVPTAAQIVNRWSEKDLAELFAKYGEERHASKIARAIVEQRKRAPLQRTLQLAQFLEQQLGKKEKIHPATRVFQALRIEVNQELQELAHAIEILAPCLCKFGRGAVITFHSLEDRIVKNLFRDLEKNGAYRRVTKKPVVPTPEETQKNRRSRGAKLRVIERVV